MFKVVMIHNDNHPIPAWVDEKLRAAGMDWEYRQCERREDLQRWAFDADVLWTNGMKYGLVVEENMDVFKKAGAVIKPGSGTDHIDHAACTKRGIIIAHSPNLPTESTSDHHIALLFSAARQVCRQDRLVREGHWGDQNAVPLALLTGAQLGLIGFGRIGRMIAKKLAGFAMTVRVFDPYISDDDSAGFGVQKVDLNTLLQQSQFVHIACPLTDDTRGLLGESELRMMRRDAILVNAARGGIVNEDALAKALREKWIAAAAVDVLEERPMPGDELLTLDNLIITPHIGGNRSDYPDYLYVDVVEDIIRMSRGLMPRWIVNKGVISKWNLRWETDAEPDSKR